MQIPSGKGESAQPVASLALPVQLGSTDLEPEVASKATSKRIGKNEAQRMRSMMPKVIYFANNSEAVKGQYAGRLRTFGTIEGCLLQ